MIDASGSTPFVNSASQSQNLQNRFQSIDSDGSGSVSFDEFQASAPQQISSIVNVENVFAGLDSDSDGQLTENELLAAQPPSGGLQSLQSGGLSGSNILQLQESGQGSGQPSLASALQPQETETDTDSIFDILENDEESDDDDA